MKSYAALFVAASLAAMAFSGVGGVPQDVREGVEVTGVGEVAVKPDVVVIRGEFSANADSASDALTKYRDGRRRAVKMMESLGLEGLTVAGPGPTVSVAPSLNDNRNIRAAMMGMDGNQLDAEGKVQVRETLSVRVGGLSGTDASAEIVAKVVDKAKEAGIRIGGSESIPAYLRMAWGMSVEEQKETAVPIAYVVNDRAKLDEAACVQAMEDARKRAEMLARIAGRKIGRPISIRHHAPPIEKAAFDGTWRVSLQVVFELER